MVIFDNPATVPAPCRRLRVRNLGPAWTWPALLAGRPDTRHRIPQLTEADDQLPSNPALQERPASSR
jgi:hypothetical protein